LTKGWYNPWGRKGALTGDYKYPWGLNRGSNYRGCKTLGDK